MNHHTKHLVDNGIPGSGAVNEWTATGFRAAYTKGESFAQQHYPGDEWMENALKNLAIATSPAMFDKLTGHMQRYHKSYQRSYLERAIKLGIPLDEPFPAPSIIQAVVL